MILDLFRGPGGWSEGLRLLGLTDVGIEWDAAACATAHAAGHLTIRADVAAYPAERFAGRVTGLIASPPCQMFSAAGKGFGRLAMRELTEAIIDAFAGLRTLGRHRRTIARSLRSHLLATTKATRAEASATAWRSARNACLVVQPARWWHDTQPEWMALEQVPDVLPLWQVYARELGDRGWSAQTAVLNAADFGVPQTRRRAFLVAHRTRPAVLPTPTHEKNPQPSLFGERLPWVSMAEALGWDAAGTVWTNSDNSTDDKTYEVPLSSPAPTATSRVTRWIVNTRGERTTPGGNEFPADQPSWALTEKTRSWVVRTGNVQSGEPGTRHEQAADVPAPTVTSRTDLWRVALKANAQANAAIRPIDEPAPSMDNGDTRWLLHTNRDQREDGSRQTVEVDRPAPAPALTAKAGGQWAWDRPATTIAGDPRCWPPGHKVNADDRARLGEAEANDRYGDRAGTDAIKLTIIEALILQGFDPAYPVQGSKTKQFEQVGNAVPPPLAAAVIGALIGVEAQEQAA